MIGQFMQVKNDWDGPEFDSTGRPINRSGTRDIWYPYNTDGSPSDHRCRNFYESIVETRKQRHDADMDRYFTDPPAREEGIC